MNASSDASATGGAAIDRRGWLQAAAITAAAAGLFVGVRLLPVGSDLHHLDFKVQAKGAIEFCDPANPAFIPVVSVPSPVQMKLQPDAPPRVGEPVTFTLALSTSGGKPIGPVDLVETHTKKLHLMLIDPGLSDYHHEHPLAAESPGRYRFTVTPQRAGTYRAFADFVPFATGRGLYAAADFKVEGIAAEPAVRPAPNYRFSLAPTEGGSVRAGESSKLSFRVESPAQGAPVLLEPVMGAYAHLVAFDQDRSGFAHLHPLEVDPLQQPDPVRPTFSFQVSIPQPGLYRIWSQVRIGGEDLFAPFDLAVEERR